MRRQPVLLSGNAYPSILPSAKTAIRNAAESNGLTLEDYLKASDHLKIHRPSLYAQASKTVSPATLNTYIESIKSQDKAFGLTLLVNALRLQHARWKKDQKITDKYYAEPDADQKRLLSEYEAFVLVWSLLDRPSPISSGRQSKSPEPDTEAANDTEHAFSDDDDYEDSETNPTQEETKSQFLQLCFDAQKKLTIKSEKKKAAATDEPVNRQEVLFELAGELLHLAHLKLNPASPRLIVSPRR
ncbi:MAG: hypothetical protein V4490_08345 [Pseudomonadota bacterium]